MNFSEEIKLENDVVRLTSILDKHKKNLLPIALEHPNLLEFSPPAFGTEESLVAYVDKALRLRKEEAKYSFVIFDKNSQSYVGSTSFMNISDYDKRLEIGSTWIAPRVHGTGLNKNMKYLMLSYAFEELEYKRVEFKTDSRNLRSRRAMEKLGAIYEGKIRSHTVMQDGFRRDTVYYAILSHEWPTIKATIFKDIGSV